MLSEVEAIRNKNTLYENHRYKTVLLTTPNTNGLFLLDVRKIRSAAFIEVCADCRVVGIGETTLVIFVPR